MSRTMNNGEKINTYSSEITSSNILEVETGTTGYHGGDSGCTTYFRLQDKGNTRFTALRVLDEGDGLEITLEGDSELDTFLEALEFTVDVLKSQIAMLGRGKVLAHGYSRLLPLERSEEKMDELRERYERKREQRKRELEERKLRRF